MLKKIILGFVIVLVLLIAAIVAIPFVFKDQINAAVKLEINKNLEAKVDYSDFDLSLFRSFPNFSLGLKDFTIVGKDDFKGDTLVAVKDFRFTLDIMTVLRQEKYKILAIILKDAKVNAIINKQGKANWDIVKSSKSSNAETKASSQFAVEIKKYEIENGYITYNDEKGSTYLSIQDMDFEGSGDVSKDIYLLETKTKIAELTAKSGAVAYLSRVKVDAKNDIEIDQKNAKYTFKTNEINLNDLSLLLDGFVKLNKENTELDVKFKSKQAEFKSILSMIPAIYKKDFDKIKTSGKLSLDGFVKGLYTDFTYPGFSLNLLVDNAMFQYPSLPTAVNNINIKLKAEKPQGSLDLTVVDISKLHADIGADPIDAVINVRTPVSDPNVNAKIHGKLNLANVPKLYPMEGLKKMEGLLVADLDFKGRMSDVQKKNYAAIQAAGTVKVTQLIYDSKETPMPLHVSDLALTFNPKNVTVNNVAAVIGKSDFNANGSVDNFIPYLFNKGDLAGQLNLESNLFDANEWLAKDGAKPATTSEPAAQTYFQVPAHIDFTANSTFGKILYDKLELTNVKGAVLVKDEAINLNNLFANLLGGSATISAKYDTKNSKTPHVTFAYAISNFDFQQTYKYVGMAEKMAPVVKYIQGNFSSDLKGSGALKEDMSVDYASLTGDGKVQIPSAKIVGLPILQKIAEVTKISALQNLELKNAMTVLQFKDGKVNVDPTNIKFGNGYNMQFQGKNGFDQSIDYDVRFDVPSKELGGATSYITNMIPKIPGIEFKMQKPLYSFKSRGYSF